jgi:hypothetical protein
MLFFSNLVLVKKHKEHLDKKINRRLLKEIVFVCLFVSFYAFSQQYRNWFDNIKALLTKYKNYDKLNIKRFDV